MTCFSYLRLLWCVVASFGMWDRGGSVGTDGHDKGSLPVYQHPSWSVVTNIGNNEVIFGIGVLKHISDLSSWQLEQLLVIRTVQFQSAVIFHCFFFCHQPCCWSFQKATTTFLAYSSYCANATFLTVHISNCLWEYCELEFWGTWVSFCKSDFINCSVVTKHH